MPEPSGNTHTIGQRLGFGVSGALSSRLMSEASVRMLVDRAIELGVRHFDTAPSYGGGEGERRLGEIARGYGLFQFTLSTKAGVRSAGLRRRIRDFSPDGVRRSIDESFGRMRVDRIDWLFLHGPAPEELTDGLLKVIDAERFAGRIGALGIAGRGQELDHAVNSGLFKVFMTPIHSGLGCEQRNRLAAIKASGAQLIGIETFANSLPRYPVPTSVGASWRLARAIAGRASGPVAHRIPASEALRWAYEHGGADRVMVTTTVRRHLEANAADVIAVADPRRDN
ncbi:hypothetical protein GC169_08095 [bacterium]|nr:hypothetical protein [bacterium]